MAAAFRASMLRLQRTGSAGEWTQQSCGIGGQVALGRRQQLSWKEKNDAAAATRLGLVSEGLAARISHSSCCRTTTSVKPRGHANDVEMEEPVKSISFKGLDRVVVPQNTFSPDDDFSSPIRKAKESVVDLFQQLFPATLIQRDDFSTLVKLAVIASVIGLHACHPAWGAGTEIAKADVDSGFFGDLSDIQNGFASSFLLIFFSEIGDKTFFIAALLATRKPGAAVFSGTFGALAVMTVISVILGRAFHYVDELLPSLGETRIPWDDLAAVILLVYFGVSTLVEAASMGEESKQEEEQQEAELAIAGVGGNGGAIAGTVAATFALVFVAEWGDKSFFSTIALAAASSPLGVVSGAVAGHGAATLLAVLGGSFLANYVSEKVIAYVGGALFLVFAGITLVEILS